MNLLKIKKDVILMHVGTLQHENCVGKTKRSSEGFSLYRMSSA